MGSNLNLADVIAIVAGFFGSVVIIDLRQRVVRLENTFMRLKNRLPEIDEE